MGPILISVSVAVGAYGVALLSIYLGYDLFVRGATGAFKFSASAGGNSVGLESVAPGIGFALFGAFIAIYATRKLMGPQRRPPEGPQAH